MTYSPSTAPTRHPVRTTSCAVVLACLVLLIAAAVAQAKAGDKVIADWKADNHIDHTYSLAELDAAKARIGNSQLEYTSFGKELERVRAKALIDQQGGKDASGQDDDGPNKVAVAVVGALIVLVLLGTGAYYLRAGGSSGARRRGDELDAADDRDVAGTTPVDDGEDDATTVLPKVDDESGADDDAPR